MIVAFELHSVKSSNVLIFKEFKESKELGRCEVSWLWNYSAIQSAIAHTNHMTHRL